MIDSIRAWVTLNYTSGISKNKALKLINQYGDPINFIEKKGIIDNSDFSFSQDVINFLYKPNNNFNWKNIEKIINSHNIKFITYFDDLYPIFLKNIINPPLYFFYRGNFNPDDFHRAISIVGTRKASSYGKIITKNITKNLVEKNCVICSGLAYGIDSTAHQTTVENKGKTYAVMATSCDKIYPATNKDLAHRILENGALISELLPTMNVEKWNFTTRNRIISALSLGTLVVEGSKTSGALLTAKYAIDQNKDIFAIPGDINRPQSEGPNYLITLGAKLVTSADDILNDYSFYKKPTEQTTFFPELNKEEYEVYQKILESSPSISFDLLVAHFKTSVSSLSSTLLDLEIKGVIKKSFGNKYSPTL